ncbi:hypothetical protein D3C83_09670 [compost metagenome]
MPIGELQRLLQQTGKVRVFIDRTGGRAIRERIRRNEVAPPQRRRIELQLGCSLIDQTLDHVGDVRPARAAIRRNRRGVGERDAVGSV